MNRRTFIKRGALFVPTIFVPRLIRAKSILTAPELASFKKKTPGGGGGGGGTYTLIGHGIGTTNTTFDTTGANLIVAVVGWFSSTQVFSDNKSNSYTGLTAHDSGGAYSNQIFYCINPTVGSTTFSSTGNLNIVAVSAFSLSSGIPAYDSTQNGSSVTTNNTTIQTGSVTPSGNNRLIVAGCTFNDTGADITNTIDSSFLTPPYQLESGARSQFYVAQSFLIQTTGSAVNPTFTFSGIINNASSSIAVFQ